MSRAFHTLDVFTETPFAGNPLAIVTDGEGLDTAAMQAIAREFNLSETVFLFSPQDPAHTARVRIFTPAMELPFAGHPTVGTAVLLALQRQGGDKRDEDATIVLEENIGPVQVGVRTRPGAAAYAVFDIPRLSVPVGEPATNAAIAAALGLAPEDIGFENHVPSIYSAGNPFCFVPVRGLDEISRTRIVAPCWDAAFKPESHPAAFIYTRETARGGSAFHARMFWPAIGIGEDPATGSAVAAFTGVICRFDSPGDGHYSGLIEQGFEMGRESLMTLEMEIVEGAVTRARIGGHAVPVTQGTLLV